MNVKKIIIFILFSTLIFSGCSHSNKDTAVSNEKSTAIGISDNEKKDLVKSIASGKQGTIPFNKGDRIKYMTASRYYELLFEHFDEQELYDSMNESFGLTDEQYVEDYETFWNILRDNYPFWGYLKEQGFDMEQEYSDGLKLIKAYPSAFSLQKLILFTMNEISFTGHLSCISNNSYDDYKKLYTDIYPWNKMYKEKCVIENLEHWEKCDEFTKAWVDHVFDTEDEPQDILDAAQKPDKVCPSILGEIEQGKDYPSNENVLTNVVLDGKCAYLKLNTFVTWNEDKEVIATFMGEIGDCDNLIIDLRGNDGGNDTYWINIVSYLTEEKLSYTKYGLTNITDLNKPFIDANIGVNNLIPISEIPKELEVNQSDLDCATYYSKKVTPVNGATKRCDFDGKVWLIVDSNVYSASENFTMFCKQNHFATIVGSYTGGDGCYMDPINVALPNTGLMFRFSTFLTLNPDGSNNEEKGTEPDILIDDGGNALNTIFEMIS